MVPGLEQNFSASIQGWSVKILTHGNRRNMHGSGDGKLLVRSDHTDEEKGNLVRGLARTLVVKDASDLPRTGL